MYRALMLALLLIGFLSSCVDENLVPLEENVFGEREIFIVTGIERDTISEVRASITVSFSSVYDQLNQAQKDKITGILVEGPRSDRVRVMEPSATSHVLGGVRFDWQQCFNMSFITTEVEGNSQRVRICVNP